MTQQILDGWGPAFSTQVSDALIALPKPVYIHCGEGWEATLYANLHLVRVGALAATDFYPASLALGFDFQAGANPLALSTLSSKEPAGHFCHLMDTRRARR